MLKSSVEQAIENIRGKSQGEAALMPHAVTINFHPDRFTSEHKPLLEAIAEAGCLKSQFETGTSNGGLTAYHGGERWLWEQRVFDGAYDNAPDHLRPKYGALNFRGYEMGASPRFGSAYFQLKPHVLSRTTFCYPDSYFEPENFAVFDRISTLIHQASLSDVDLLDDYIEAHIHGVLSLADDVDCLVLDPIFRATDIEQQAVQLDVPVKWHNGYALSMAQMRLYPEYRGLEFIDLAQELAQDGKINAKLLGTAVTKQGYNEQDIKKIWHYLARFGYQFGLE
ncbi:hypothetical protein A3K86_16835 [Photobacterium jeanii]|uniref:DUF3626 domain-containing protein n=1 Tax=Photobacterium jeanii TaxID=858640 RepID=A0A178K7J8_9GAMM|nr:DUF3626 domain-containing protein [Photobacterium jeanii]OAN13318.1 hypothetical protein A3K86_16835 [Photobacterium jeanii]PST90317.1 DUF3626 domain-containing protein [Photobacterium jeanii]